LRSRPGWILALPLLLLGSLYKTTVEGRFMRAQLGAFMRVTAPK
jgi:hypothetical protein